MQNINLYQRERRSHGGPRPKQMLRGLAIVALLILCHGFWQGWQLQRTTQLAREQELRAQGAEAQLREIEAGYREPKLDSLLASRLTDREAENRRLQRLADHLQRLDIERRGGFSPLLAGLAERHPPRDLWLTRIRLRDGGNDLALQGFSRSQETLPQYLQSLGQNAAFSGRDFAHFALQRDDTGVLRFQLSSHADSKGDQ